MRTITQLVGVLAIVGGLYFLLGAFVGVGETALYGANMATACFVLAGVCVLSARQEE